MKAFTLGVETSNRWTPSGSWPDHPVALAMQIYADFNKEHGTDFEFKLKKP
jgi:hypothetical protein